MDRESEILSRTAHEMRNPVGSLRVGLQLIRKYARDVPPELFEIAFHSIERLTRLGDDLMDLSVSSTKGLSVRRQPADLAELARDAVKRGSRIVPTICESLPGEWDEVRTRQIMDNLIDNAMKYSKGIVRVRLDRDDHDAVFTVRDEGIGIAPEDRARIFAPFERAAGGSGLGLGLSLCAELVRLHDGRIEMESEVGVGSTFTVRLPIASTPGSENTNA